MKLARYIFIGSFLLSTFFLAPFLQYCQADETRGSVKRHTEMLSKRLFEYAKIWPSPSNPLFVLQRAHFAEKFEDNFGADVRRTQINLDESGASTSELRKVCVWPDFKQIDSNGVIWMALEFSNCAANIQHPN